MGATADRVTRHRAVAWIAAAALLAAGETAPWAAAAGKAEPLPLASAEAKAGVEVVALRRTMAGRMLDFRFRVVDPDRAVPLLNRATPAYLLDESSGARMEVPSTKVGRIRAQTMKPEKGRVYFMFFNAAGHSPKPGDRLTVVVGEHRFENLTVQ